MLFLDEMAEFKRQTLEILRQPMEDGTIFLAKSGGNFVYPADFLLIGAANPCPCGYYPDRNRCRCTPREIRRYLNRISGPLLDRIDLCCTAEPVPIAGLLEGGPCAEAAQGTEQETEQGMEQGTGHETEPRPWDSRYMRERVLQARERQKWRYAGTGIGTNGRLHAGNLMQYCHLGTRQQRFLEQAAQRLSCSARACHRILKVARTLADLDDVETISSGHLGQALHYWQNEIWNRKYDGEDGAV